MRTGKYLALLLLRTKMHLKSMGVLFWVPIILVHVIIPVVAILSIVKYNGPERLAENILPIALLLTPLCSAWWSLFTLREYAEGDGHEVLYVCCVKMKFADVLFPYLVFIISVVLQFSFYTAFVPIIAMELVRIICVSLFYVGCAYFLMMLTKSLAISFMALLIYTVVNLMFITTTKSVVFPLFYEPTGVSPEALLYVCVPMAVAGVLFLCCGAFINRKAMRYN